MLLRLVIVFLFFQNNTSAETVIGLTFLVWIVNQFFAPADNAAVLAIVARDRLAQASPFLQATSVVAAFCRFDCAAAYPAAGPVR